MKYLCKGMGMPGWGDVSGSVLLGWHEKLTEVTCRHWLYCTSNDSLKNCMTP
ncbi:hypothetical protein C8R48DRAFT_689099 [Suillus tomentosus]|nr:hypothetical protein C8R48DRAFT_689099 [Suillus tomentosus]